MNQSKLLKAERGLMDLTLMAFREMWIEGDYARARLLAEDLVRSCQRKTEKLSATDQRGPSNRCGEDEDSPCMDSPSDSTSAAASLSEQTTKEGDQ